MGYETDEQLVFDNVDVSIDANDRIGLVGHNGVGKTTLLKILSGEHEPTKGEVTHSDVEVGRLPQDLEDWLDYTVESFLETVTGVRGAREFLDSATQELSRHDDENTLLLYQKAFDKAEQLDIYGFEKRAQKALKNAGMDDVNTKKIVGDLSGGEQTRLAMAGIFASRHDIVLLDEPTNNLDQEGIVMLEKYINGTNAGFMIVSHDRRFLRNATSKIVELLGGDQGVDYYGLGFDEYVAAKEKAREAAYKRYDEYEKEKSRIEKSIKETRTHAHSAEHNKKSTDRDKLNKNFRQERASSNLAQKTDALKSKLMQLEEPELPPEDVDVDLYFPETQKSNRQLIDVRDAIVMYEGGEEQLGPYNLTLFGDERVHISGSNGVGKSTLVRAIMNPDITNNGEVHVSPASIIGYIDQNQRLPLSEGTPLENLQQLAPNLQTDMATRLLVKLNVKKDTIYHVSASQLSGGERAKVHLAAIAANKANLLIMDEPTNNLDIPSIEALESALKTYKGALIVVSHDREFVQNIGVNKELKIQ